MNLIPDTEVWKDVLDIPGYKVSNLGRVKSCNTEFYTYGGTRKSYKIGRILKPRKTHKGYLLIHTNSKNDFLIHRLVAKAFLPQEEGKYQVNHKDGNKENNNVENLEWCTASENCRHAHKNGLRFGLAGEKNGAAKFKDDDILKMKELRTYMKVKDIAAIFKANPKYVSEILIGKARNK